jgi:hypothetical protein
MTKTYQEQLEEILSGVASYGSHGYEDHHGLSIDQALDAISALNAEMIGENEDEYVAETHDERLTWRRRGVKEGRNELRADLRQRFGVEK